MSKAQLIAKLETVATLYNTMLAIQNKMDRFQPVDKYARQIAVPPFPGNYQNEQEREAWKKAIPHENADAVEIATATHKKYLHPKEPAKPAIREFVAPINATEKKNQEKYGCLSKLGLGVAIFFFLGIFFGDVIGNGALPTTLVIIALAVGAFLFFKMKVDKSKAVIDQERAVALEEYNQKKEQLLANYAAAMKAYESDCAAYETTSHAFLQEYSTWRPIYLKHLQEEAVIAQQLEADRQAEVNRIYAEEYAPVEKALTQYNDLITAKYLPVIGTLIDLLKSGRADDLKEAVNLYEDIVYREKQLKLEREKEEHRRQEAAEALEAEERRHRDQMRFQEDQERQRQREAEQQQKLAEQQMAMQQKQHAEMMRAQADAAKRQEDQRRKEERAAREREEKAREAGSKQCQACVSSATCNHRIYNRTGNCTGFRPR